MDYPNSLIDRVRKRIGEKLKRAKSFTSMRRNRVSGSSVSVVLPFHNAEPHLAESIDSVLDQDIERWNLILIDDGSTDQSKRIAKQYVRQHQNIQLVSHEIAQGPAKARNFGIAQSSSDYIAFLDSDDRMSLESLRLRAALLDADSTAGAAYSPVTLVGADGQSLGMNGTTKPVVNFADLSGNLFITSCMMVRRAVLSDLGGFDPSFRHGEDWDLWLRLTRSGLTIRCAAGSKIDYRQHAQSLSHASMFTDYELRTKVAEIAWSADERCVNPHPAFRGGIGQAMRAMGDCHRAFTAYISCLFMGQASEAEKFQAAVDPSLLCLSDPKIIADGSKFAILRNSAHPKSQWNALKSEKQESVVAQAKEAFAENTPKFLDEYLSELFA